MKKLFTLISVFATLLSCHNQDYYQTNPNAPTGATPALLLTGICVDVFNNDPTGPAYSARYITYYERPSDNVNYGWVTAGFGAYATLRQVKQMEKLAEASGERQYAGVARFFRAVLFSQLTETFGDVPYSQALKGDEGVDEPTYDTQEAVYAGLFQELEQANEILAGVKTSIEGDVIFGGKAVKWQQAVNAFRLRLLIHLSKQEGNAQLNIKKQFADILGNPSKYPLLKDNADNAQLVFNTSATSNYYPTFNNLSVSSLVSLEKGLAKLLKERNDPRIFQYGDPIVGKPANDFASYEGVDAGLIISDQQNAAPNASKINRRYVKSEVNEPLILIGFPEQEFLLAEGIARGWAAGNAAGYYNSGVRASMRAYNIGGITIEQYLNRPNVKYDATKALEMIAIQKYLALFMQSGWEPFLEQRRTGFPSFSIGPGTLNNGRIPKRWRYPQSEYENNRANVRAAVERQYSGNDDVNQTMWLLR
jgi:Starch-binding associating with outer membrane